MENKFNIVKCVCSDTTFEEMKEIMKANNLNSIEALKDFRPVADNCRLCLPYIKKMIQTGQTKFDLINDL